jgi:hypothetical protein
MSIDAVKLRTLIYTHTGWAPEPDDLKAWFSRLGGLTPYQVDEALRRITENRADRGLRSRVTVAEVYRLGRTIRLRSPVVRDEREAPPVCDCPRLCSRGLLKMEDERGYEFLAHCDCARGEYEIRQGNKLARTGRAEEPCFQDAAIGRGVIFYLGKGCTVVDRAEIRWSDRGRQWILDETNRLQAEGMTRRAAHDKATAEACHKRMQQRGGLLAGIGR